MAYVFIWDSMRNEMSKSLFIKTLGASLLGEGFTLSNFVMISDNNECVLLDVPFGNAVKGDVYLLNNKGITILEKFYDTSKYSKKNITCYYNSCGCNQDAYEKINCIIYCINKPILIENYIKKISKKTFIIESGDWKNYSNTKSLNN